LLFFFSYDFSQRCSVINHSASLGLRHGICANTHFISPPFSSAQRSNLSSWFLLSLSLSLVLSPTRLTHSHTHTHTHTHTYTQKHTHANIHRNTHMLFFMFIFDISFNRHTN